MANTTYNKVTFAGKTLIDLTGDTVTADKILSGYTAHDKSGKKITGTFMSDLPLKVLKLRQKLRPLRQRSRPLFLMRRITHFLRLKSLLSLTQRPTMMQVDLL